jgi:hypothetical protein
VSNEISINISNSLTNPTSASTGTQLKDSFAPGTFKFNQATQLLFSEAITCTTSDTLITFTGVTTQGWCMLQNLDATNYVTVGPNNSGAILNFVRLVAAGGQACFQLDPSAGFRVQANTGSCKVLIKVWNT